MGEQMEGAAGYRGQCSVGSSRAPVVVAVPTSGTRSWQVPSEICAKLRGSTGRGLPSPRVHPPPPPVLSLPLISWSRCTRSHAPVFLQQGIVQSLCSAGPGGECSPRTGAAGQHGSCCHSEPAALVLWPPLALGATGERRGSAWQL